MPAACDHDLVSGVPSAPAEQQNGQFRVLDQFEVGHGLDAGGDVDGLSTACARPLPVLVRAVNGQARTRTAGLGRDGSLGGVVRGVPRLPIDLIQVARVLGVSGAGGAGIAVQQRAAVIGREEPLVRVDDELSASSMPSSRDRASGRQRRAAVRPSTCSQTPASCRLPPRRRGRR